VLPPNVPVVAVEAGAPQSWHRWVGPSGMAIGIERFGASAPYQRIYEELGLTVDNLVVEAKRRAASRPDRTQADTPAPS